MQPLRPWALAKVFLPLAGALYLALCFFAQPVSDDYFIANLLRERGFWSTQAYYYTSWTGRYSLIFFETLIITVAGLANVGVVFAGLLLAALGSAQLAAKAIAGRALSWAGAFWLGLGFLVAYLSSLPDHRETLYWLTGAMAYQLGVVFALQFAAALGFLWRAQGRGPRLALAAWAGFAIVGAAGCNEIMMAQVLGCATLATLFGAAFRRPAAWEFAALAVVAGAAAAVVYFCPGNAVRHQVYPDSFQLTQSVLRSLYQAGAYAMLWAGRPTILLGALVFLPAAVVGRDQPEWLRTRRWLAPLLAVLWFGMLWAAFFPSNWAIGAPPPERALSQIFLLFLVGWFTLGPLAAMSLAPEMRQAPPRWLSKTLATVLVLCVMSVTLVNAGKDLFVHAPAHLQESKAREALVRQAVSRGELDVVAPQYQHCPESICVRALKEDPAHWINRSYAEYWGLRSFAVRP